MRSRSGLLRELWLPLGALAVGGALIAAFSMGRRFCTFGTETDFLAEGIGEALRILRLEPLLLEVHPPAHALAIALIHLIVPDWVTCGLLLSWLSALLVLLASFRLFRSLAGEPAAWGSLAGLLWSGTFVAYAAQATSDLFFLALVAAALLLAQRAIESGSGMLWALLGCSVGLCLLTRANGLTFLVLFASPWCVPRTRSNAFRHAARMAAGFMTPVVLWVGFAWLTQSPLLPQRTYASLAQTYYPGGPDRISGDVQVKAGREFHGALEVLARDPLHVARVYVRDLLRALQAVFLDGALLGFPFMLFALPGTILLLLSRRTPFLHLYTAVATAQLLLVNLKAYEPRYYLFLVPLLGAGAGRMVAWLLEALPDRRSRVLAVALLAPLCAVGAGDSYTEVFESLHAQDTELAEAVPVVEEIVAQGGVVVARKPHVSFYAETGWILFPDVSSWDALEAELREAGEGRAVHVYYGSAERHYRGQFGALSRRGENPAWLRLEAESRTPGGWSLYRFEP